jgi:hypothetical protein
MMMAGAEVERRQFPFCASCTMPCAPHFIHAHITPVREALGTHLFIQIHLKPRDFKTSGTGPPPFRYDWNWPQASLAPEDELLPHTLPSCLLSRSVKELWGQPHARHSQPEPSWSPWVISHICIWFSFHWIILTAEANIPQCARNLSKAEVSYCREDVDMNN